jgi:hypothetical protein
MHTVARSVIVLISAVLLLMPDMLKALDLIWENVVTGTPAGVTFDSEENVLALNLSRGEVLKYDIDGTLLWKVACGEGWAQAIDVDREDNVLVASYLRVVTKLTPEGEIDWTANLGDSLGYEWVWLYGIDSDPEENVFVSGELRGNTFTTKLSSAGNVLWTREETQYGIAYGVCTVDPWGDVIVLSVEPDGTWFDYNWRIIKYDTDGEKLWERWDGSPWEDVAVDPCTDDQGSIYIGGQWMVKYDSSGDLIWFDPHGLSGGGLSFDGQSSIYFGTHVDGESPTVVKFGVDGTLEGMYPLDGGEERSIIDLDCFGGTGLAAVTHTLSPYQMITSKYSLQQGNATDEIPCVERIPLITPNPAVGRETIRILLGIDVGCRVEILDLLGRRVRVFKNAQTSILWDGRDEAGDFVQSGLYVCRIRQNADDFASVPFAIVQ